MRAKRIPAAAPGLRASPSHADEVARACAMPQNAEAIAMAKPDVMATQLVGSAAPGAPPWANAAGARNATASKANKITENFFIRVSPSLRNGRSEVVPGQPRAAGLTRGSG